MYVYTHYTYIYILYIYTYIIDMHSYIHQSPAPNTRRPNTLEPQLHHHTLRNIKWGLGFLHRLIFASKLELADTLRPKPAYAWNLQPL